MRALYWTFGLSWSLALAAHLLGLRPQNPAYLAFAVLYMWVPGLVALAFARKEGVGLPLAFRPNRFWLFAWLFPVALTLPSPSPPGRAWPGPCRRACPGSPRPPSGPSSSSRGFSPGPR